MKIAYTGLNLASGKVKYDDSVFVDLVEKFKPAKSSPYYFEFLADDYEAADAIVITEDNVLDLLILDIEWVEGRLSRVEEDDEREVLAKCLAGLEDQQPICNLPLDAGERAIVKGFATFSSKPTVVVESPSLDVNEVCRAVMEGAGVMFFYTAAKQEVHAWMVKVGSDALTCADKIHSDLARGFIKAELVSHNDMMTAHNLQDARTKGLTKLVDGDYIIPENTIIDIRFNV